MADIKGITGMSPNEISFELNRGAKFVRYRYCFSAVVVTMTHSTDIYLVRPEESRLTKSLPWSLLTLVAGWWGIPWGPIRSVQTLWINFRGGEDVTTQVAAAMQLQGVNWDTAAAGK